MTTTQFSQTYSDDQLEPINCDTVYSEWTQEHLSILAFEKNIPTKFSQRELRDNDITDLLVSQLSYSTRSHGTSLLINEFDKATLLQLTEPLGEEYLSQNGRNPKSKMTLAKRLTEVCVESGGLLNYLFVHFESEQQRVLLRGLIEYFGKVPQRTSRKRLAEEALEVLETFYLQCMLIGCPAGFLRNVCESMYINHHDCNSSSLLADCIITGNHYEGEERSVEEPYYSKKPKRISEKCNRSDLNTYFLANELREWLVENNLKSSGKKSELAQRIIDFFDPNKENEKLHKDYRKPRKSTAAGSRRKRVSRAPADSPVVQRTKKVNPPKPRRVTIHEDPMEEDSMDFDTFSSSDDM